MKRNQHTIGKDVTYKGLGLHSGMPVTMTMHPAAPGTGIIFKRSDLPGGPEVPAQSRYITNTLRATTLEKAKQRSSPSNMSSPRSTHSRSTTA